MNTASRVQSVAVSGEILVTEAVYQRVSNDLPDSAARPYELKGFDRPLALYVG